MKILKIVLGLGLLLVGLAWGAFEFFKSKANARLNTKYDIQVAAIPIPFPLTTEEIAALADIADTADRPTNDTPKPAQDDHEALAKERAIARGKRYVESRAGCTECHGLALREK